MLTGIVIILTATRVMAQSSTTSTAVPPRDEVVKEALSQNNLFDCATYTVPDGKAILPAKQKFLRILRNEKITNEEGIDYTGALWSPSGDALLFVAPTTEIRKISVDESVATTDGVQLIGTSINRLFLYSLKDNDWQQIAADGASPVWSADGQSIYFMAGVELMKYELSTKSTTQVGLRSANTGIGLLLSQPLPNGQLLASPELGAPVQVLGAEESTFAPIELATSDRIFLPSTEQQSVIAYGATSVGSEITPAVAVLRGSDGDTMPLMQNCQYSAMQTAWSPDGNYVAYPVHATYPEIRIYDVHSGQTKILIRWDAYTKLNGLSWSFDGKFLAFTQGDAGSQTIWVTSTDGKMLQSVATGLLPNWSPDGTQILYTTRGKTQLLDWRLLTIDFVELAQE